MSRKNITIIIGFAVIFAILLAGIIFYNTQTIPIRVAPENAKILLDGKEIANESRQWVKWSSDHTISISADGYTSLTEKISEQGVQTVDYMFCLVPESTRLKDEQTSSQRDSQICDGVGGRYQNELARKVHEKNPILNEIPINEGLFSIGQGLSVKNKGDGEKFALYVHYYNNESLADAKKWISERADINSLEVIYVKDYSEKRVAGNDTSAAYKALEKNYPLVGKLPFKDPYFTISYRSLNDKDLRLVIYTPSPRFRYEALRQLRILGFNQADYDIEFVDYSNPLGETK